jgi:hypothetical protein
VLATNCRKCHSATPQFGAPMPLVTFADLHAPAKSDPSKKVFELVPVRIADDASPMPQPPNPRLSAADRDTLTNWAAAGAPADPSCDLTPPGTPGTPRTPGAPPGTPPLVTPTACTPDLPLAPSSTWEMPGVAGDEYVCYGVDVTRATPTHVVGFSPRIVNTKIVHHVVLFESDSSFSSVPTPCSAAGSLEWRMVTGWAPGGKGFEMPPEAGFPIATSGATHYVVQIHYSNPQGLSGEKDTSGFDLCTAPPRPNEADVVAFGTQSISIPPKSPLSTTCSVTVVPQFANVHFVTAMPHMHKLGTSMSTILTPASGGAPIDLGTMKSFSFDTQAWLPIAQPAVAHVNDIITTTCSWMNPTETTVSFGETTAEEMCYSFTVYYPKIQASFWSWALPAMSSTCQ